VNGGLKVAIKSNFFVKLYLVFFVALVCFAVLSTQNASAHATLEKVTPQENSIVQSQPKQISLQFNEPVNTKYSSITIFDDSGNELDEVKPNTTGHNKTLDFDVGHLKKGTHKIKWHAMSADGHEVGNQFEFSIGKKTANNVDTTPPFFETAAFWFGFLRFLAEGSIIILIGLFLVNKMAIKKGLPEFNVIPKYRSAIWMIIGVTFMTCLVYLMSLTSDVSSQILTLNIASLLQVPLLLSLLAIIVLLILFSLKNMLESWYILMALIILVVLSMSGHAFAQHFPIWSIIIRTIHLVGMSIWLGALLYLFCITLNNKAKQLMNIKNFLLRVNSIAVLMIIISGVLMVIDESSILNLFNHLQTWSVLVIIKIVGVIVMMCLGAYQTTRVLSRQYTNKSMLSIEIIIGIVLIVAGIIMSQINIPI
jgi:copper transport protein